MSIMDKPPEWRYWFGRRVFLSDKASNFRCGGCYLTRMNPVHIVNDETQVNKIIEGVKAGILVDITDNPRGLQVGGIGHSATKTENTGRKIFITTDKNGGLFIKSAETEEEIRECESKIQQKGIIVPDEYKYKIADPLDTIGRVSGPDTALVLHNLEEKVAKANEKVFGDLPHVKPGPNRMS